MSENTSIEWCDHTFNPWEGCQKVGPGCDHCYAEARNVRWLKGVNWGPGAPRRRTSEANWRKPVAWNKTSVVDDIARGHRQRVFCASLADVFDNEVDPAWRADLFKLIRSTPNLDWLLLTKRVGNAQPMISEALFEIAKEAPEVLTTWPWPNVWIGATVVNQAEADRDIPKLLAVPARVRFLSIEPMLGPVDLTNIRVPLAGESYTEGNVLVHKCGLDRGAPRPAIDWVICGGESGPGARPMPEEWPRSLAAQCKAAGTAFMMKQMGGLRDKRGALEDLPEDLRVREFPL